ncbi:MAG: aromatic amino acid ammonia-lyase, partial [Candidatus Cloacimonetes bacterium]|nr:aromatic amino acid ammonia-lyase [Candidatus Cloacimonadota bacterium]
MAIELIGTGLTIEKVERIARYNEEVIIPESADVKMKKCRKMLEDKIEKGEIMYGVNTGIGEFSEVVLKDDQIEQFQKFLIYNHAAGIGDPAPLDYVRGAMAGRINVLVKGHSGCRPIIAHTLKEMLNKGLTPFVCQKGSVGASGDLAPMSQIALLLMGEGQAYYKGELYEGKEAMERAGIAIPGLKARDGLASINGSNLLTAMSALMLCDTNRWFKQAEIAAAMTLEALKANFRPYRPQLHELRG